MIPDRFKPLLDTQFLKAEFDYEFKDFLANGEDDRLRERLAHWAKRELKRETQAEGSFIQRFFVETWGYRDDGVGSDVFHLWPKFAIAGAGQTGGQGEADLAVGTFGKDRPRIPQVVCEFKDIRSGLDKPQNRKGNNRSPVYQARDYLWNARRRMFGNEPVQPRFAIVTDMDEFRLYWWDDFPDRYLRFKLSQGDLFNPKTLLDDGEDAAFERFNRADRAGLSALARGMQERRTRQVELRSALAERLAATARVKWPLERILPNVRPVAEIEAEAPKSVPPSALKKWVDDRRKEEEEAALAEIDGAIRVDSEASVELNAGKLSFLVDEQEVARVFISKEAESLVEAQWRAVAIEFAPTGRDDAKKLLDRLRRVATSADPDTAEQIIKIGHNLAQLSEVLNQDEEQLHELTCHLFQLSDDERQLVERARS